MAWSHQDGQAQTDIHHIINEHSYFTFSRSDDDLGYTSLMEHAIDTGQSAPLKQPPRRPPIALMQEEKDTLDKLKITISACALTFAD